MSDARTKVTRVNLFGGSSPQARKHLVWIDEEGSQHVYLLGLSRQSGVYPQRSATQT